MSVDTVIGCCRKATVGGCKVMVIHVGGGHTPTDCGVESKEGLRSSNVCQSLRFLRHGKGEA